MTILGNDTVQMICNLGLAAERLVVNHLGEGLAGNTPASKVVRTIAERQHGYQVHSRWDRQQLDDLLALIFR